MSDRTIAVKIRAEYQGYKSAMADIRAESAKTATDLDRDGNKITSTTGRIIKSADKNRDAWDKSGRALTLFGAAGVAALAFTAKAAIEWESAWTGVLKTVNGSHDELAQLEMDLRQIALVKPANQSEIAAVAEAAGQLGVQTKNVAAFTAVMVDLGETTNLSAEEAATAIAQLMNVMQTAPENVDRVGAALVALGNNGASTERDIILMSQRIAGAGKIIGLTEGEVMGLSNALASVGIDVEAGGSAISKVMIDVSKAVSSGSDDLTKWASLAGMSADAFATAWKNDPAEALATLIEGLGKLNAAGGDVFTTLDDLGQSDVRVTRALLTMANSGDLLRTSLEQGNQAWADNTALVAEANKRYDTTAAKAEMARNALNDAAITIGEDLLPMLASLATHVADVAQWFGALPDPVRQTLTGLTGVTSVALLAAGGFLMLAPRVFETISGFKTLKADMPGVASGLGKFAKGGLLVAGIVGGLALVSEGLSSITVKTASVEEVTAALLDLADGVEVASTKIADLTDYGFGDTFVSGGKQVHSMADAFEQVGNSTRGLAKVQTWLSDTFRATGALNGSLDQSREAVDNVDKALASLVQSGASDKAKAALDALGIPLEYQNQLLPTYTSALADVANGQRLTTSSTAHLASAQEQQAATQQLSVEALDKWREGVGAADAAFIDSQGAYDLVIAKNTEWAQSTADSTESADDSWQTYYDGLTVSADDYIAQLQAQVDAQTNWEANMVALSERVNTGMTGSMRDAANNMIDELTKLGPEGAAQVELLRNMSDEQLTKVVTLYGEKGTAAGNEMTARLEATRQPVITPTVNLTPAINSYGDWLNSVKNTHVGVQFNHAGGFAGGGALHGPGTSTSDSFLIRASDGEYMVKAAAHNFWSTRGMDAINNGDAGSLMRILSARGFAGGGSVTGATYNNYVGSSPNVNVDMAGALAGARIVAEFGGAQFEGVIREVVDVAQGEASANRVGAQRGR